MSCTCLYTLGSGMRSMRGWDVYSGDGVGTGTEPVGIGWGWGQTQWRWSGDGEKRTSWDGWG